jgi:hypothetical protein
VVRPPMGARRKGDRHRGQLPPSCHRCRNSQLCGGVLQSVPMTWRACRQTRRMLFLRERTCFWLSDPDAVPGKRPSRQQISSAIQLPIPGKRLWSRSRAFRGLALRRWRISARRSAVKVGPVRSGGRSCHHGGGSGPVEKRTRPNRRGSVKISEVVRVRRMR